MIMYHILYMVYRTHLIHINIYQSVIQKYLLIKELKIGMVGLYIL